MVLRKFLADRLSLWLAASAAVLATGTDTRAAGIAKLFCPPRVGTLYSCECYGYFPTAWRPWPCQPPAGAPAAAPAPTLLPPPMKVLDDQQSSRRGAEAGTDDFRVLPGK
jgi:hypothetical protein